MKKIPLHLQILLFMILGIVFGIIGAYAGFKPFIVDWVKPFGTIFINMLKLIAIPLIIVSLIKGIVDLHDINKFKTMGVRTFVLYIVTTVIAVSIGLILVNIIQPGNQVSNDTIQQLSASYGTDMYNQ